MAERPQLMMPPAPTARTTTHVASDLLAASRETGILDRSSALRLAADASLSALLAAATQLRAQEKGAVISFSKKVFIPLTTLCRDYCSYCTFRKDPGQPGAHFMTPDEVLALAEQGRAAGCKEALFSLGDQPERIFPEAREFLRHHGFARTLDYVAAMCEVVLDRVGLLPHANPGVMDRPALERLKESNASVGLMLENVRVRLMRDPHMNLQARPNLSYADFPHLLEAGINDWGGISPVTKDFINPEAAWPQIATLRSETEARGFTLRERLAIYPEFIQRDAFLSAKVRLRVEQLTDASDYIRVATPGSAVL